MALWLMQLSAREPGEGTSAPESKGTIAHELIAFSAQDFRKLEIK